VMTYSKRQYSYVLIFLVGSGDDCFSCVHCFCFLNDYMTNFCVPLKQNLHD
jgi:hypothetical protein